MRLFFNKNGYNERINTTTPIEIHYLAKKYSVKLSDALKIGVYLAVALRKAGYKGRKSMIKVSREMAQSIEKAISSRNV